MIFSTFAFLNQVGVQIWLKSNLGGGGGGGVIRRQVCFWMHYFLQIFDHSSSTPIPPPPPPPPTWEEGGSDGGMGWGWGEGGVFLDSFLEFLELYEGYGRGEGCLRTHTHTLQTRLVALC